MLGFLECREAGWVTRLERLDVLTDGAHNGRLQRSAVSGMKLRVVVGGLAKISGSLGCIWEGGTEEGRTEGAL